MKKLIGLTVFVLFFSLTVNAQQRQERMNNKANFTPEQMATLQAKKMALRLDLTANQQKEVESVLLQSAQDREKNRIEYREKKQRGELTADEQFTFENDRIDRQLAHKKAMKKILNEEQYEKWEKEIMGKMGNRQKGAHNFQRKNNKNAPKGAFNSRN